jgi:hypothetical protein
MRKTTILSIDSDIPGSEEANTPVLVFYDNGDWEVAFAGDVDYIRDKSPAFVGSGTLIEIFNELLLVNGFDEIDEQGTRATLLVDLPVTVGALDEPVVGYWLSGEFDTMLREHAEQLVKASPDPDVRLHNFIPVVDLVKETRNFLRYHAEDLAEDDDITDDDNELLEDEY